ncbi:MAG: DUF3261 domain-containing protein [Rhodospirillaceae bacterium]|jgi:hypothetical protein|nr:DUF3261 domain-containing protein [Rhodospirillaceae bacterium]MBT6825739.1 DUF3261 domain-containing protein [Rhodospirillales bacterium]MBT4042342.1 DUF3261 domain-containing protein [Rhodospirillaceae bacterium]MBT5523072.1 DUF3261 domain-containing protein [Rhodospirillaceae bacterium]MBT5878223.1 DUF3261 domain-containing protein [Rhodospirillaceae bacterium]
MKRAVLILLVVLTACQRPVDEPIRVTLAPGLEMTLPELHPTDGEIVAVQTITGTWKGQNFALQAHLVAMGTSLDLIALDPLGRRTMTIEWRDGRVRSVVAPWMPTPFTAEMMLAHFVLIYWQNNALRDAFSGDDIVFDEGKGHRRLLRGDQVIVAVDYAPSRAARWNGTAQLVNNLLDYKLSIQSKVQP